MKNHRSAMLCVCFALLSICSYTQNQTIPVTNQDNNKTKHLNSLPDFITTNIANLNTLLKASIGQAISINLDTDLQFMLEGQVVSVSSTFENTMQSVVVRSTNFPGARLTFSRINNTDGTLSYTGRIISIQNGDLFELQNQNGQFVLIKKKLNDFVNY